MKQIAKLLTGLLPAAAAAFLMLSCAGMPCAADGSIEDVYAAMRRIGMPESMIQEAKTQYQNTQHDDSGMKINDTYYTYDIWADMVEIYEDDIWNEVGKQFNVPGSDIREQMKQTETQADPQQQNQTQTTAKPAPEPSVKPEKPFINMTLEEKQAYVASLPESERAAFLASLSTSERNSIIKQMDKGSQANVMNGFIDLGEQLGMHISVDQLDGSGISYSVRNSDGELIDANAVSASADDTGWNMTVPVIGSAAAVLGGITGLAWISLRGRKREAQHG
ncbi:MAG: hypothetical protein K5705_00375 [Oscillospiraceae bacterium]|nr:hypothetical protein [Oscillospiraceae bacterium]